MEEDLDEQVPLIVDGDETVYELDYENETGTELLETFDGGMIADLIVCESAGIGEDSIWLTAADEEEYVFSDGTLDLWLEVDSRDARCALLLFRCGK